MKTRVRTNGDGKPIVALDIDGTLGDYHAHFLWFAARWFGLPMPDPKEINPGERLHKFMSVPLAKYRECKLAFRQGGLKRFMPAYEGVDRLTASIQTAGAEVWICTTRPYLRLDSIDPDTREWLRRNRVSYDAVLFGDDKYRELARQAAPRVAAVVDDLPEMTWDAFKLGFRPVLLRNQPYNQHVAADGRLHGGSSYDAADIVRVQDCGDIWMIVADAILQWKEHNEQL